MSSIKKLFLFLLCKSMVENYISVYCLYFEATRMRRNAIPAVNDLGPEVKGIEMMLMILAFLLDCRMSFSIAALKLIENLRLQIYG